jgi:hypothetical protein
MQHGAHDTAADTRWLQQHNLHCEGSAQTPERFGKPAVIAVVRDAGAQRTELRSAAAVHAERRIPRVDHLCRANMMPAAAARTKAKKSSFRGIGNNHQVLENKCFIA